ncbi:hypothetical protein [Streptomyces radicis]|uniref:Uncharacterized protein n=1 Tax=Streptomyces radicis TaxID=1750517 RepID=A0A3A9W2B5_9ACTN|nr:hypothetical protein [Streptomyces radicis]RKN07288.1 hypothetical protein D7319_19680 [Streptomyces radicis]RKN26696.1 hypothetical protein D7318_04870 [Streptomyces radicis]
MNHPTPFHPQHEPDRHDQAPPHDLPVNPGAIELATERRVVWVPDAYGTGMVPITRDLAPAMPQPTEPRDLTPRPVIDPRAQVLVAAGAGAGLAGAGLAQLVNALAAFGTAGLLAIGLILAAAKMPSRQAPTSDTHVHITNHNRLWGRSATHTNL